MFNKEKKMIASWLSSCIAIIFVEFILSEIPQKRILFLIFCSVMLCPRGLLSDDSFTVDPLDTKGMVIYSDDFKNFRKIELPQSASMQSERDVANLKYYIPVDFTIDHNYLSQDLFFGRADNGFLIRASQAVTLYTKRHYPISQFYLIEVKISIPASNSTKESLVEVGISNAGMYKPGTRFLQQVKLNSRETQTILVPINFREDFGVFRPAFRITGEVILEKMAIYELPTTADDAEWSIVEGTIAACSSIPNPQMSDYPDCRFICHFVGNSILQGESCPREISLVLEGFAQRKILGTKKLKPGDKVCCIIVPFDSLPPEKQAIQQSDDLNLFSLKSYYVIGIYVTKKFHDLAEFSSSGIPFSNIDDKPYISVFKRQVNCPIKEEFRKMQQDDIAGELQKINDMLAPYDKEKMEALQKTFSEEWKAEKAKDPQKYNRIDIDGKEYVWRNVDNSFYALPEDYRLPIIKKNPVAPYNIEALIALRDFLEANGCQLLVVPIPDFQDIAARVILPKFNKIPDFRMAEMTRQLLRHGIWTFYSSDILISNFNRFQWAFFYPQNYHPADTTHDVIAELVAKKMVHYHFPETLCHELFSFEFVPHIYRNDPKYCFRENCDIGENRPGAAFYCRQVLYDGKVIYSDNQSPILIIGNSFMQIPMYNPCSFPTILSSKINIGIQSYLAEGKGPMTTAIQHLFSSPEKMLSGKKIVILVMAMTHFTSKSTTFNNISDMDEYSKTLYNKKLIKSFPIHSNVSKEQKLYQGLLFPNYVEIPQEGKFTLIDSNIDAGGKEKVVVIPTCMHSSLTAEFRINGQKMLIPTCEMQYRHMNVIYKLPAETDHLEVEVVGRPQTVLSIQKIQIYQ